MILLTLDTNCVIPFVKHEMGNRPEELDALTALINAADDGSIELQLAVSYDRDAARTGTMMAELANWSGSPQPRFFLAEQPACS